MLLLIPLIHDLCKRPVSVLSPPQCSKSCGAGHRRRALQCVDHKRQEVHEMYCVNQIRPPDIESCNTHACELIWITGEWTEVRAKKSLCHLNDVVRRKILIVKCQFVWTGDNSLFKKDHSCESRVMRTWQKSPMFPPVWNPVVISCRWFILFSSAQPAVVRATASVWSPAARCMWRMTTMSTAISLCLTAPGPPLRATCLVTWTRAHRSWSGGLGSGDRWATPWF